MGHTNLSRAALAAVMLLGASALAPATATAQQASLAQRLQVLEDKEAIRSVLERFFEYQENGPQEAFAGLFATDGEMVLRLGTSKKGPDGRMMRMSPGPASGRSTRPNPAPRPAGAENAPREATQMRHILSNAHIEVKGDTATAVSRFTLLSPTDDNRTRVGGTGRYYDQFVRENGQWKIKKRIIARDIPIPEPGTNPPLN